MKLVFILLLLLFILFKDVCDSTLDTLDIFEVEATLSNEEDWFEDPKLLGVALLLLE